MNATAASPPRKTRFTMCSTFRCAALSRSRTWASTPTRSRWRTVRVTDPSRSGSRFTQWRASPDMNASTISVTPAAIARCACTVDAPMWWVATTFGCRASGESHEPLP